MAGETIECHMNVGMSLPDYDKKLVRKALAKEGRTIVRLSKRKLRSRKVSKPGEAPGKQTGALQKSISSSVNMKKGSVLIEPNMRTEVFYPSFVIHGHRAPNATKSDTGRNLRHRKKEGVKVALPRLNVIPETTKEYGDTFSKNMETAFLEALK